MPETHNPPPHGWHLRKGEQCFHSETVFDDSIWLTISAALYEDEEFDNAKRIAFCVRAHYDVVAAFMEGEHSVSSEVTASVSGPGGEAVLKAEFEEHSAMCAKRAVAQVRAAMAIPNPFTNRVGLQ